MLKKFSTANDIPEPGTLSLLALAGAGLGLTRRRATRGVTANGQISTAFA